MIQIDNFIRAKTVPIRSIALTKIDENMPVHVMTCTCDMCREYQSKRISQILSARTKQVNDKIAEKVKSKYKQCTPYYLWVIKHLIIPHNKIITRGLDIFIPDIVFYKDGEARNLYCGKEIDDPAIKRLHKQKISNTLILKIFGDRRRKYREKLNAFFGRKRQLTPKSPLKFSAKNKEVKRQAKDGVIIKYIDGLQNIITQSQFLLLMQKRKLDPIWRQIFYIKNSIPQTQNCKCTVTKFIHGDIKYQQLYNRAHNLTRVYGQNILPLQSTYIKDQQQLIFCKQLQAQSVQIYGYYLVYKIAHFIQYFYDEKILMMVCKFYVNQMGQAYLDDVMKLQSKPLIKYEWSQQVYLKKIQQQQQKVFFSKQIQQTDEIQKNAKQIEGHMNNTFQKLKQYYGLAIQQQDHTQEIANNQFFKTIHPSLPRPISQILSDKNMTVQKFKRVYLGYKDTKKPMVRPFTSNMISSLHHVTPQFSQAQTHQYINHPKRTISTAISRTQRRRSMLSHQKNQLSYTKSFTSTHAHTPRI